MPHPPTLLLRPITRLETGESVAPFELRPPGPWVVGRSSEADWRIGDQMVSRRHASLLCRDDQWFLMDLGSRHGVTVNSARLAPHTEISIACGDIIGFGQWLCRCQAGANQGQTTSLLDESSRTDIAAIDPALLTGVAQTRLQALLALAGDLNAAESEQSLASAVVQAVSMATSCKRVVVARQTAESEVEVLASTMAEPPRLSRSLIEAAAVQGLVELRDTGPRSHAKSIVDLDIRAAICAAIGAAGGAPSAFLVLDARGGESALPADASAFCHAVARLAGLALARLQAAALAARHKQLQFDLAAARRAQEMLLPPPAGRLGDVSYAFESLPGRVVAGDLFDVFPLDDRRIALVLGDVAGKGVGAAVLMAAAQSQLRTRLQTGCLLAETIAAVNRDLFHRTESGRFVTLLAVVIDAGASGAGAIEIVDAGHGMCILWPARDAGPARLEATGGLPLGVIEEADYRAHTAPFAPGDRIVLFSDGATEQPDPSGAQFGFDAVLRAVARGSSPESIAQAVVEDVQAHAGGGHLADDLTVAAAQLD